MTAEETKDGRPGGLPLQAPTGLGLSAGIPDAAALSELLGIIRQGHWEASVYHAPPNRRYPRGGIMCGTSITLNGQYQDRESALQAAREAITQGRVSIGQFIHGPSATPYARFNLEQKHIEALALAAQGIEAGTVETERLDAQHESPVACDAPIPPIGEQS